MSLTTVYTATNIQGNMVLIGNTLGLAKASNTLTPGTLGSIGAFITTDSTQQAAGGWGVNTTLNWQLNSSPADLELEANSNVIKAYLFWSADYINGSINLTTSVPNAVTLIDPTGVSHSVLPGSSTTGISQPEGGESATYYQNYTDVTTIVQNGGNGTWICGSVPCALNPTSNDMNYAGWALQVVYTNTSFNLTNVVIQVGPNLANDPPISATINYGGPPLKLYATIGYAEGDAILSGDGFNIAGIATSGSNNPSTNIFCSQINYPNATLNTSGPYGTINASPTAATNPVGCRQGWDVMKVPVNLPGPVATTTTDIPTSSDPGFIYTLGFVSQASQPAIVMTKHVDKTTASSGDILTYTVVIKNTIQAASDFIFVDTMPTGAVFEAGTVKVNGVAVPSGDPTVGIPLGTIPVGGTETVTFNVITTPLYTDSRTIVNFSTGNYSYTGITLNAFSNAVTTTITNLVPLVKTVSETYGTIGDVLTYTLQFQNQTNNTITNVVLVDTTPNGTTFVPNSVSIDFVNQPGYVTDPPGVIIPDVGSLAIVTITYNVTVNTIPNPDPIPNQALLNYTDVTIPSNVFSNIVKTQINTAVVNSNKIVNNVFSDIGQTLTYTVTFKNTGNATAFNVVFTDTIPIGTTFVNGSLTQDGTVISSSSNPPGTILPNNISPGKTSTLTFKVTVSTIPSPNPILNSANAIFSYTIDNATVPNVIGSGFTNTNIVSTQVNNANLGGITKSVDKAFATCGDVLNYTIVIPNTGNITAFNVIIKDTLPNGTVFIANSVTVNGVNQAGANPLTGVTIPTIRSSTIATLTFQAKVQC